MQPGVDSPRRGRRRQEVKALDCGFSIRGFESPRLPFFLFLRPKTIDTTELKVVPIPFELLTVETVRKVFFVRLVMLDV